MQSAFEALENARKVMNSAIQVYQSACASLISNCASSSGFHDPGLLGVSISRVDCELEALADEEASWRRLRLRLTTLRNRSHAFTRINTLPSELLVRIFAFSRKHCAYSDQKGTRPYDIAGVCSDWRQLAMNTPDLWTHIDIQPETPGNTIELLFRLASNLPTTVHFCERSGRKDVEEPAVERERRRALIAAMTPYMHRISHLDLESYYGGEESLPLLKLWLDCGSPNSAKSLMVYRRYPTRAGNLEYDTMMRARSENAENMLRAIDVLHFNAVDIGWESGAFRGLTDFRFDASSHTNLRTISTSTIFDVLLACPALAILNLRSTEITPVQGWNPTAPVKLGCLKILNLTDLFGIQHFLPIIDLPKDSSDLSVGLPIDSFLHNQVLSFVAPCQMEVLRLSYNNDYLGSERASLFTSFPRLSTLVLTSKDWPSPPLHMIHLKPCPRGQSTALKTVVLLREGISLSYLEALVDKYQLKNIRLDCCCVAEGNPLRFSVNPLRLEDMANSLAKRRSGVQCYASDIDSTRHLSAYMAFGHDSYM